MARPSWLGIGLVVLLATLPYVNAFSNGFAFDDKLAIIDNPRIKSLRNVPTLLTTGYWFQSRWGGRLYRPLVTISYALNYAFGGLDPFGYHLVNLVAHLGVSLLVYRLALRLFHQPVGALVAAAFFAVHPLHTEAVTGIVGRAELFAAGFFLLAWWWYLERRDRPRAVVFSWMAFALALVSKESALTLPGLLVLSDLYDGGGEKTEWHSPQAVISRTAVLLRRYAGYLAVVVGYLAVRIHIFGMLGPGPPAYLDNPLAHVGLIPRVLTALKVSGRYLWLMLWPWRLSPDYSYNQIPLAASPWEPGVLLAGLAWIALIALACWSYRGRRRTFLCLGFTVVTFSIASNILAPIGTIMGERLFYLPSAGLCLLVGVAWQAVMEKRRSGSAFALVQWMGVSLLAVIVVLLGVRTVMRNRDWRDQETLFLSALKVAPDSAKVHFNLGGVYLEKGLYDAALQELQKSLDIYPTGLAHRNMGTLYLRQGRPEEAIAQYREALALDPRDGEAYNNLGYVLLNQGSTEEALDALQMAVILEPKLADAHYTLGRALAEQERRPEAIAAYEEARRLKPDFVEASYALGLALQANGDAQGAAKAFEEALRLKPGLKMAHKRLAELYREKLNDPEKARQHSLQAE